MERPYQVGKSCEAWCTRCKLEAEHTIIAMVDSLPKRVECNSCHSHHNYRLAPDQRRTAKMKGSRSRRISRKLSTDDTLEARLYSMTGRFESDEVVEHESFGVGIVQQVQPGNKIEVLFKSGKKLLVHGR